MLGLLARVSAEVVARGADAVAPGVEAQLPRLPVEARALWDRIRRG